jgi:hypothetical protein
MRYLTRLYIVAAAVQLAVPTGVWCQEDGAVERRGRQTIQVNLATRSLESRVPFNEHFRVVGKYPAGVDRACLSYGPAQRLGQVVDPRLFASARSLPVSAIIQQGEFAFDVGPLQPRDRYRFTFVLYRDTVIKKVRNEKGPRVGGSDAAAARPLHPCVPEAQLNQDAGPLPDTITRVWSADSVSLSVTPGASFRNHIDADVGALHSFNAGYTGLVTNVHLYAYPLNKNEDLSDRPAIEQLGKRFSVFLGLAVQELNSDADVDKFLPLGNPVVGVGLRGFPGIEALRVNTGIMLFKQDDANPLVTKERLKYDPFVSVTADIEFKTLLGPLANLLG